MPQNDSFSVITKNGLKWNCFLGALKQCFPGTSVLLAYIIELKNKTFLVFFELFMFSAFANIVKCWGHF